MRASMILLMLAYVLSQFYRAFLAVLSPVLSDEIGASAADLSQASGVWFLAFAAMQIPIGSALDRIGPRLTASVLLAIGAIGALLFGMATKPWHITAAMALIGAGCAPVLMASYFIFARLYPARIFATLAGAMVAFGNLGNILSSSPLAWAVETWGWRPSMLALSAVTLCVAIGVGGLVRDPPRLVTDQKGSLLDLLRMPPLWPVLIMMVAAYGPAASLRGLWVGPYYTSVFRADADEIGFVTLIMGLAMVVGNLAYGPLDRLVGSRKRVVLVGNAVVVILFLGLWAFPTSGGIATILMIAGIGLFGATFPVVMAHGRAFLPPHLTGRGVTLINLFGIGGAGLLQLATGKLYTILPQSPADAPFAGLFLFLALVCLAGLIVYLWSEDRTD
jgi:MFS family permease